MVWEGALVSGRQVRPKLGPPWLAAAAREGRKDIRARAEERNEAEELHGVVVRHGAAVRHEVVVRHGAAVRHEVAVEHRGAQSGSPRHHCRRIGRGVVDRQQNRDDCLGGCVRYMVPRGGMEAAEAEAATADHHGAGDQHIAGRRRSLQDRSPSCTGPYVEGLSG